MAEQPIPLQTDTVSALPGGGVRTVNTVVSVNGVPTVVQMQVICLADPFTGQLFDLTDFFRVQHQILTEIHAIREELALLIGAPAFTVPSLSDAARQG